MKFDFKQDYFLQDEIIQLRPLETNDFEYLKEYSINEPDIWKFNAGRATGAENLKTYIDKALKQRENNREYPFIVFDKRANNYVGSTRFYNYDFKEESSRLVLHGMVNIFKEQV